MKQCSFIQKLESTQLKKDIPTFAIGDTIAIHQRIIEAKEEGSKEVKERIQLFAGTVIARKGCGLSETITLYKVSYNTGVERVFSLHSPRIAKIEVKRKGKVRRSKLYYLRGKSGKKARVKENRRANLVIENNDQGQANS